MQNSGSESMQGSKHLHVAFIVTEAKYFLSHRLALALAVQRRGARVTVVSAPTSDNEQLQQLGFNVVTVPFNRKGMNPVTEVATLTALVKVLKGLAPDVVHNIALKPVIYGSLAARVARVPTVINTVAGLGYAFASRGALPAIIRQVLLVLFRTALGAKNSKTIFQNKDDLAFFQQKKFIRPNQGVLIPGSGVDLTRFAVTSEPSGTPRIVTTCRMLREKGVGDLVEAARLLLRRGVDCQVVLAGEPDPNNPSSLSSNELENWTREGIAQWIGHQSNVPQVLSSSQIVCLPSYYREGIPLALIEAAAAGRPIVTTDMPGCREIVQDGVNGILVPPRDVPALANALERLIKDVDLRRKMGLEGRRMAETMFAQEIIIDRTLAVYRSFGLSI